MSNLSFIPIYKKKIINLILGNKLIIKLLNPAAPQNEELDTIDVLLGGEWIINGAKISEQGHVFDYDFVDNTVTQEKTFIFVDVNPDTVILNTFVEFDLYICIFCAKNLVRLTDYSSPSVGELSNSGYKIEERGNRIDILCDLVDTVVNGNEDIPSLGEIEPYPRGYVTNYSPQSKFYGKCLRYRVKNSNETGECGYGN